MTSLPRTQRSTAARCGALFLACLLTASLSGCGSSDGPPRVHISGAVSHRGAPVPYGEIIFEPDGSENNTGPSTRVTIENGAYSTKASKGGAGIVGGPTLVRITGFDNKPGANSGTQVHGKSLFKQYTTQVDLPKQESTKDFEVPGKK